MLSFPALALAASALLLTAVSAGKVESLVGKRRLEGDVHFSQLHLKDEGKVPGRGRRIPLSETIKILEERVKHTQLEIVLTATPEVAQVAKPVNVVGTPPKQLLIHKYKDPEAPKAASLARRSHAEGTQKRTPGGKGRRKAAPKVEATIFQSEEESLVPEVIPS